MMNRLELNLDQASGVPFYRQLADQIGAMIRSGSLHPGARLPSVRVLTGQVLVSLITVRKAYDELERAGLINRRQGQGSFVSQDVGEAARREATRQALEAIAVAVERARRLGMGDAAIRVALENAISKGKDDG